MNFSVYVDFARSLDADERTAIIAALDARVPGGGCVGTRRQGEELFFEVEAQSIDAARTTAERYARETLQRARVESAWTLSLHSSP